MIVRADGCYEYHLNHEDEQDAMNDDTRAILEVNHAPRPGFTNHTRLGLSNKREVIHSLS